MSSYSKSVKFAWDSRPSTEQNWYRVEGECASPGQSSVKMNDKRCKSHSGSGKNIIRSTREQVPIHQGQKFLQVLSARDMPHLAKILKGNELTPPVEIRLKRVDRYSRKVVKPAWKKLMPDYEYGDNYKLETSPINHKQQELIPENMHSYQEFSSFALMDSSHVRTGIKTSALDVVKSLVKEETSLVIPPSTKIEITDLKVGFKEIDTGRLRKAIIERVDVCGHKIPTVIKINSDLADGNCFADFLVYNGYSSSTYNNEHFLRFNGRTWQGNYHISGKGVRGGIEDWTFVFEWGCASNLAGEALYTYSWKFGLSVIRKTSTGVGVTRAVATIPAGISLYESLMAIDVAILLDISNGTFSISGYPAEFNTFVDGIGLFKSGFWSNKMYVSFFISEITTEGSTPIFDMSPLTNT